jgi:hypothetical protein
MMQQDRQCTYSYNIILWCIHVTTVTTERKKCILCVLLRYNTFSTIMILSVAQNTFMVNLCLRQLSNIFKFSCKVTDIPVCF